jgi:hypothetical protein
MTPEEKRARKTKYQREYRNKNRDKYVEEYKTYYANNKHKKREYYKSRYVPTPLPERTEEERLEHKRAYRREYEKRKKQEDIDHKIRCSLRNRLKIALKNSRKNDPTLSLLGCGLDELKQHLESQFQPGMTWDNWSRHGWHIDHVLPLSCFDLSNPEQLRQACHYSNLRPLWAKDNLTKGSRVGEDDEQ